MGGMDKSNDVPLVKGGQGRDAESLISDARFFAIVTVAAFIGAIVGGLL